LSDIGLRLMGWGRGRVKRKLGLVWPGGGLIDVRVHGMKLTESWISAKIIDKSMANYCASAVNRKKT
jgi:hypothetical protein